MIGPLRAVLLTGDGPTWRLLTHPDDPTLCECAYLHYGLWHDLGTGQCEQVVTPLMQALRGELDGPDYEVEGWRMQPVTHLMPLSADLYVRREPDALMFVWRTDQSGAPRRGTVATMRLDSQQQAEWRALLEAFTEQAGPASHRPGLPNGATSSDRPPT